eukprot:gnl/Chilomastix_cuspidata/5325.p1 GENE.gnl/Chilomastix_cuspidata/5325~~gnl/Chilomastix_cuspidata/5325.p1  ORF type:complete len:551 (-),score=130.81 gnl/Chilomastix_cuspidata/5325:147-1799(-)
MRFPCPSKPIPTDVRVRDTDTLSARADWGLRIESNRFLGRSDWMETPREFSFFVITDVHGNLDAVEDFRLHFFGKNFTELYKIDAIIVLGDILSVSNSGQKSTDTFTMKAKLHAILKKLGEISYTVWFVPGNHDPPFLFRDDSEVSDLYAKCSTNVHNRLIRLADGLVLAGLGGSCTTRDFNQSAPYQGWPFHEPWQTAEVFPRAPGLTRLITSAHGRLAFSRAAPLPAATRVPPSEQQRLLARLLAPGPAPPAPLPRLVQRSIERGEMQRCAALIANNAPVVSTSAGLHPYMLQLLAQKGAEMLLAPSVRPVSYARGYSLRMLREHFPMLDDANAAVRAQLGFERVWLSDAESARLHGNLAGADLTALRVGKQRMPRVTPDKHVTPSQNYRTSKRRLALEPRIRLSGDTCSQLRRGDSVILLCHQGPAGSATSTAWKLHHRALLEMSMQDRACAHMDVILPVRMGSVCIARALQEAGTSRGVTAAGVRIAALLHGHTHAPMVFRDDLLGFPVLNPGALNNNQYLSLTFSLSEKDQWALSKTKLCSFRTR